MSNKKIIVFIGLIIVLSGCSINTTENDTYDSNEHIKTKKDSEPIEGSTDISEEDMNDFEKIGEMSNGEELYYDSSEFYNKTGSGEKVIIKRNSDIEVICKGAPSKPKLSPNKEIAAFIDYIGFEVVGNLFVYDTKTKTKRKLTDYEEGQQSTVKVLEWLDNEHILLIIGYDTGTITQGGNLYLYDMTNDKLKLILNAEERKEFVDVAVEDKDIMLTIVVWTDDNYTEYKYIEKRVSIKELIKSK